MPSFFIVSSTFSRPTSSETLTAMRVDRMGKRVVERHGVALAGGEVLRRPVAAGGTAAAHDGVRRVFSRLERGEIDVRLERGAGLAVGVGGAVELALAVVLAADQRAHGAVVFHDDHRALLEMAGVARLWRWSSRAIARPSSASPDRRWCGRRGCGPPCRASAAAPPRRPSRGTSRAVGSRRARRSWRGSCGRHRPGLRS